MSNNFILAGFNDSQEISSSRVQNTVDNKNKSVKDNDNHNIITKNITKDLSIPHSNSNNKYKLLNSSNTHMSKSNISGNSFQK